MTKPMKLLSLLLATLVFAGCIETIEREADEQPSVEPRPGKGTGNRTSPPTASGGAIVDGEQSVSFQECDVREFVAHVENAKAAGFLPERFTGTSLLPGHTSVTLHQMECAAIVLNETLLVTDAQISFITLYVTDSQESLAGDEILFMLELVCNSEEVCNVMKSLGVTTALPGEMGAESTTIDQGFFVRAGGEYHASPLAPAQPMRPGDGFVIHLIWSDEESERLNSLPLTPVNRTTEGQPRPGNWSFSGGMAERIMGPNQNDAAGLIIYSTSSYHGAVQWVE